MIPRKRNPMLIGHLGSYMVEIKRRDKTEHTPWDSMRQFGIGAMLDRFFVRKPVKAVSDLHQHSLVAQPVQRSIIYSGSENLSRAMNPRVILEKRSVLSFHFAFTQYPILLSLNV